MTQYAHHFLTETVNAALKTIYPQLTDADLTRVVVEPPRDATHGDMATNAAMVLNKLVGEQPRVVAEKLAEALKASPAITAAEVAGPGFLNLRLAASVYQNALKGALQNPKKWGHATIGKGIKTNVEFVSANPTGPLHLGHTRNAVYGDALARLLEVSSYSVAREYYTNDAGAQVDTLGRSALLRYREALGEPIGDIPEGLYPGDYLVPVGKMLAEKFGQSLKEKSEAEALALVKPLVVQAMMDEIRKDLTRIGIKFDVFTSEKDLSDKGNVDRAVQKLTDMGLTYVGVLPPPKSKKAKLDDWEETELLLFKSTAFGDDQDRPLKKSDGTWSYATPDIAYEYDKFLRGFEKIIVVVAVDHAGWVTRIKAGTKAVTDGKAEVSVHLYGLVNLMRNGEPVKISKRAGNMITLQELVDEVGAGPIRFTLLTRKANELIDFDLALAVEQSKENPYFYVQYAHARCQSVLRHAQDMFKTLSLKAEDLAKADLALLSTPEELALIKQIVAWPRALEQAALAEEPHRIAYFAQDMAGAFHTFWNKGREDANLRFLKEGDEALSKARCALVQAVAVTLQAALYVLGVEPLQELRSEVAV